MATIEIRKDKRGQFRFTVKSRNGEIVATGESYKQKEKALATAKSLKIAGAKVVDLTLSPAKLPAKTLGKKLVKKPAAAAKSAKGSSKTAPKKSAKKPMPKPGSKKTAKAPKPAAKPPVKAAPKVAAMAKPAPRAGATGSGMTSSGAASSTAGAARSPASARPPRLFTPADESRSMETDEIDTVAMPEGADIVTADQLGDGDQIADGVRPAGADESDDDNDVDE